jgi:hypothetical protein
MLSIASTSDIRGGAVIDIRFSSHGTRSSGGLNDLERGVFGCTLSAAFVISSSDFSGCTLEDSLSSAISELLYTGGVCTELANSSWHG